MRAFAIQCCSHSQSLATGGLKARALCAVLEVGLASPDCTRAWLSPGEARTQARYVVQCRRALEWIVAVYVLTTLVIEDRAASR